MDQEFYQSIVRHIKHRLRLYPEGGTREQKWEFFSDLDNSYQTEDIVDPILENIYVPNLILTGSFGAYVVERIADLHLSKDYILFNGHIREGAEPKILAEHHCARNIETSPYIQTWMLFDDSNYSGRTRFVLENWMLKNRSHPITSTLVIYNGAANFHPQVNALYSWYMVNIFGAQMTPVEFAELMSMMNRISKKEIPATLVDVCRLLEMQGILLIRILKTLEDLILEF